MIFFRKKENQTASKAFLKAFFTPESQNRYQSQDLGFCFYYTFDGVTPRHAVIFTHVNTLYTWSVDVCRVGHRTLYFQWCHSNNISITVCQLSMLAKPRWGVFKFGLSIQV